MENAYSVTTINGDFCLKRNDFPSIGISICLPDYLDNMREEEVNMLFPAFVRPTVSKTNTEYSISFMLKDVAIDMSQGLEADALLLDSFVAQHKMLSRMVPGYREFGVNRKEIERHIVFCVEYMSYSLEDDLYNVFFTLACGGKIIHGTFSCLAEKLHEMRMVFYMCLDTIQFSSTESTAQHPAPN